MKNQNGINPRQHLIVIKGKDQTDQILRIARNGGRFDVTYKGGKTYAYDGESWVTL